MRENSLLAYYSNMDVFSKREQSILGWLMMHEGAYTDRQIKDGMSLADMNHVRPRITNLVDMNVLEEVDHVKCRVTKRRVRVVALSEAFLGRRLSSLRLDKSVKKELKNPLQFDEKKQGMLLDLPRIDLHNR